MLRFLFPILLSVQSGNSVEYCPEGIGDLVDPETPVPRLGTITIRPNETVVNCFVHLKTTKGLPNDQCTIYRKTNTIQVTAPISAIHGVGDCYCWVASNTSPPVTAASRNNSGFWINSIEHCNGGHDQERICYMAHLVTDEPPADYDQDQHDGVVIAIALIGWTMVIYAYTSFLTVLYLIYETIRNEESKLVQKHKSNVIQNKRKNRGDRYSSDSPSSPQSPFPAIKRGKPEVKPKPDKSEAKRNKTKLVNFKLENPEEGSDRPLFGFLGNVKRRDTAFSSRRNRSRRRATEKKIKKEST